MGTVAIGFVTSWFYSIALFFSMNNLSDLQTTSTLVPILALFYQALSSKAGAIVLESLFIATGIWCLVASHTWQSRLCWSFARDGGLPFSKFLSHVDPRADVPLRAHFVSCFIVTVLGLLYLGSYTAFNSMVTACIVLLYVSYAIPVICLLIRGRGNINHGPFWLGPVGLFANIVLLLWTCFTIIMYSFPPAKPVTGGSTFRSFVRSTLVFRIFTTPGRVFAKRLTDAIDMNYVSAVYGVVVFIIVVDWVVRGKRGYRGQALRHEEAEANLTGTETVR